jgi:hypothetical protein
MRLLGQRGSKENLGWSQVDIDLSSVSLSMVLIMGANAKNTNVVRSVVWARRWDKLCATTTLQAEPCRGLGKSRRSRGATVQSFLQPSLSFYSENDELKRWRGKEQDRISSLSDADICGGALQRDGHSAQIPRRRLPWSEIESNNQSHKLTNQKTCIIRYSNNTIMSPIILLESTKSWRFI